MSSVVPKRSTLELLDRVRASLPKGLLDLDCDLLELFEKDEYVPMVVQDLHLEAIQRRCDHDCDQKLSYSEFIEVIRGAPWSRKPCGTGALGRSDTDNAQVRPPI